MKIITDVRDLKTGDPVIIFDNYRQDPAVVKNVWKNGVVVAHAIDNDYTYRFNPPYTHGFVKDTMWQRGNPHSTNKKRLRLYKEGETPESIIAEQQEKDTEKQRKIDEREEQTRQRHLAIYAKWKKVVESPVYLSAAEKEIITKLYRIVSDDGKRTSRVLVTIAPHTTRWREEPDMMDVNAVYTYTNRVETDKGVMYSNGSTSIGSIMCPPEGVDIAIAVVLSQVAER